MPALVHLIVLRFERARIESWLPQKSQNLWNAHSHEPQILVYIFGDINAWKNNDDMKHQPPHGRKSSECENFSHDFGDNF